MEDQNMELPDLLSQANEKVITVIGRRFLSCSNRHTSVRLRPSGKRTSRLVPITRRKAPFRMAIGSGDESYIN